MPSVSVKFDHKTIRRWFKLSPARQHEIARKLGLNDTPPLERETVFDTSTRWIARAKELGSQDVFAVKVAEAYLDDV